MQKTFPVPPTYLVLSTKFMSGPLYEVNCFSDQNSHQICLKTDISSAGKYKMLVSAKADDRGIFKESDQNSLKN